jgi:hypothetical protein
VVGGSLLLSSIRGMMGGGSHQAFGDTNALGGDRSPWAGDQSGSSLARDAGLNDIGSNRDSRQDSRQGFLDQASNDDQNNNDQDYDNNDNGNMDVADDSDFGGGDDGGSDYA